MQARSNEFGSERARLLWADTPSHPPAKSWKSKQSNPVNADTERTIESVLINGVSVLSGLNLEKM